MERRRWGRVVFSGRKCAQVFWQQLVLKRDVYVRDQSMHLVSEQFFYCTTPSVSPPRDIDFSPPPLP